MPGPWTQPGRARAPDLQLQLPPRSLSAVHRPRLADGDRPRAGGARSEPVDRRRRDRPVGGQRLGLLRPADPGDRRALRRRPRDAVAGPAGGVPRLLPVRHQRRSRAGVLPQPVRSQAVLLHAVRGDRPQPRAPVPRDGVRVLAGEDRGVHDPAAVPGVQGRAAATRVSGGPGRGDPDPRVRGAVGAASAGVDQGTGAERARPSDREAGAQRDRGAARSSSRTSASGICRWSGPRRRCPAARRSESGWPPRSAHRSWASSTSSTSRRSAFTSATTRS